VLFWSEQRGGRAMEVVVEVAELTKRFGELTAVCGVSFEV
jgi:ABC-type branched-subunit amino acid transport system ATPase component